MPPRTRVLFTQPNVMDKIAVISEKEENRYSDIPGWDGEYGSASPLAVELYFPQRTIRNWLWFPFSHLRKAEDGQSIYASDWIINEKHLLDD